jgi:hypothetical protein
MRSAPGFSLLLVLLAAGLATDAHAAWQPLAVGAQWTYDGDSGGHEVQSITGTFTLRGRSVAIKSYLEGPDAGLANFWLLDADGSVLLAGFDNPSAALALAYEPPIRILPVPPVVGPQPFMDVTAYELGTDNVYATFPIRYDVFLQTLLLVPAGVFNTFAVGQVSNLPAPGASSLTFAPDGRRIAPSPRGIVSGQPTDWYAESIGVVQFQASELFQLTSTNAPMAVTRSSWGRVKRLYR